MVQSLPTEGTTARCCPARSDPLHVGHRELATAASETLGMPVTLEMSIANVDKPPLSAPIIRERLEQFAGIYDVVLTKAPTFAEKAQVLPGSCFIIGYDTMKRLIDPAYYGDDPQMMTKALSSIAQSRGRFLVAGRLDNGIFRTLADAPMPEEFRDMFESIPRASFPARHLLDPPANELINTMPFSDLRELHRLPRKQGRPPSHHGAGSAATWRITEITDRTIKSGGPALALRER